MTKELCLNALGVMDGTAEPSVDLVRDVKRMGAQAFHKHLRTALQATGWRTGGSSTDYSALTTPHMRRWELLVDGQRTPLIDAGAMTIEADWDAIDDMGGDDE